MLKKEIIKGQCEGCGFDYEGEVLSPEGVFPSIICKCGEETHNFDYKTDVDARNKEDGEEVQAEKVFFSHVLKASGEVTAIIKVKKFDLKEMQSICGGIVQFIQLPKAKVTFVCNDEGALIGLPKNENALQVWHEEFPPAQFKFNNVDSIYGDVLISKNKYL